MIYMIKSHLEKDGSLFKKAGQKITLKYRLMRKIFTLLLILASYVSYSQSTTLVISQVYGAGGNSGAPLNADYVELHNVSAASISLSGYTIQYSSATNTGAWSGVSPLPAAASIPAGGYYLIQMSSTGTSGSALPTPDYSSLPTIAMAAANGKVALVNGTTAISSCTDPGIIDLVGYGTANCGEGTPTPALSVTNAGFRNNNGCDDTNNNLADFTLAAPAPRNSATPVSICSGGGTNPAISAGTVADFGSVVVGTNSPAQSFNVSGSNLTGFPGTINITAPNTNFQVSNDNSAWGASTTLPYTAATLAATPVYVRFTPQAVGPQSGNVTINGGGIASPVTVAVSGNGIATAVATVTSTSLANFGSVCINTTAGPNSFTINGQNLTTADLVVGPLNGFTFSTTSGGTYSASLTLPHAAGTYVQDVYVQFTPTTATSYNGSIPVTGGGLANTANVAVSGTGSQGTATVVTGSPSAITQVSATLSGQITAQGCSPVTAYGFEYSTISGFSSGTVVPSGNLSGIDFSGGLSGLAPATTYYYKAFATNAGGTVYGLEQSFNTASPPPAVLSATALTSFGASCVDVEVGPNDFQIDGSNLSAADITVGPLNGYSFATSAAGPYAASLTLSHAPGAFTQTIYVKFMPPSIGSFNGNIPVTGGGSTGTYNVPVSGTGENTSPTLITNDATDIKANSATTSGNISDFGCSSVFAYGIEYSGINGFVPGSGIKMPANNLTGPDFSVKLSGLVQGTEYFYRAYAENNGGVAYGQQNSFKTLSIPDGLVIYGTPIVRGQNLHFTLSNVKPGHYSVRIQNILGQQVFQKDYIVQVNFMDYNFTLPGFLPIGLYYFEIVNYEYKIKKPFMVQ